MSVQLFCFEDRLVCPNNGCIQVLLCANICTSSDYQIILDELQDSEYACCLVAGKFGEFSVSAKSPVPMVGLAMRPRNLSEFNIFLMQEEYGVGSIGFRSQKKEFQLNFSWFYPTHMCQDVLDRFLDKCLTFRRKRVTNTLDFTFCPTIPLNIEQALNKDELSKFEGFCGGIRKSDPSAQKYGQSIVIDLLPMFYVCTLPGTPRLYSRPPFRHVNRRLSSITTCSFMQGLVSLPINRFNLDKSHCGEVKTFSIPNLTDNPFTQDSAGLSENQENTSDNLKDLQENKTRSKYLHAIEERRPKKNVEMDRDLKNKMRKVFGSSIDNYIYNAREEERDRQITAVREARIVSREMKRDAQGELPLWQALEATKEKRFAARNPNSFYGTGNFNL